MTTLNELISEGYEGIDVNLEISLFEYGIAWKETPEGYDFIHGVFVQEVDGEVEFCDFENASMSKDDFIELIHESWFKLDRVLSFCGLTEQELINYFPSSVHDCIGYHGPENVFGSSYYSFSIDRDDDES